MVNTFDFFRRPVKTVSVRDLKLLALCKLKKERQAKQRAREIVEARKRFIEDPFVYDKHQAMINELTHEKNKRRKK